MFEIENEDLRERFARVFDDGPGARATMDDVDALLWLRAAVVALLHRYDHASELCKGQCMVERQIVAAQLRFLVEKTA